jgi:hypothetical protein
MVAPSWPTNEAVTKINDDLLGWLPGEVPVFHADNTANIIDDGHKEMVREMMATMNCGILSSTEGWCPSDFASESVASAMVPGRASTPCLEVRLNG